MSEKILIYPEALSDGGIEFKIEVKDNSLIGKKATFSIQREVFVKDSRPVHHKVSLYEIDITISRDNKLKVAGSLIKKATGSFPYSGSKIRIQTFAEIKIKKVLFFNSTTKFSLSNHLSTDLPKRAKVKNNAKGLIDPKDTFNFFKNLIAIPAKNQLSTIVIILIGFASLLSNLYIGFHDQMVSDHETWLYRHYDYDGEKESPIVKALAVCGTIGALIWFAMKKQLQQYMAFHFRTRISKINRESTVNVSKLVTGRSHVDLFDPVLRIVACNMEKGKYVRGYGSNRRTVSFSHPNRAVLLYSKRIPIISAGTQIHRYFDDEISFKPMFQALYPRQMTTSSHGLDLVWEVQLIVGDFIDQELIGDPNAFVQKDFFTA